MATAPTSGPLASAPEWDSEEAESYYSASAQTSGIGKHRFVKACGCSCQVHNERFTDFDPWCQESFNSRLKAEGDDSSTNLYISNLPPKTNESELAAIFLGYTILSSKILRDNLGNSRGVGFAR